LSAPPYMKFFWGDYHKATRHLTLPQHGAYFLLIGEAWRLGGSLPDDDALLAAWALSTPEEWALMKPAITAFFVFRRGRWTHDRVRDELASYESTSRKRKEAGKSGGSSKKTGKSAGLGNHSGNSQAIANQLGKQNGSPLVKPEPEPEPIKKPPNPLEGDSSLALFPDDPKPDPIRQAFDLWNTMAARCGLPIALDLTDRRKASIGKRLEDGGIARWSEVLAAVEASAFCRGQRKPKESDRPFKADIDFVCQSKSFQRLREGFYGQDATPVETAKVAAPPDPLDYWRRPLRAYVLNGYWDTIEYDGAPGRHNCRVPAAALAEFGLTPALKVVS